jgi:hypothetical protein
MNNEPETLRLADELESVVHEYDIDRLAAAELRRLHEVNQELVEALETIAEYWNQDTNHNPMQDACYYMEATARAAISKARGEA